MEHLQVKVLDAVRATQRFLDTRRDALAAADLAGARRVLDRVAEQLATHALVQVSGTRLTKEATARQRHLRLAIRFRYMKPIAAIARLNLRRVPEFVALKVPPNGMTGQRFIVAARDLADAAETHRATFCEQGMPATFIDGLRAMIDELASARTGRDQSRARRVGATAGLSAEVKRARMIFRVLDALVRPTFGANDQFIREWEAAKWIPRRATTLRPDAGAVNEEMPREADERLHTAPAAGDERVEQPERDGSAVIGAADVGRYLPPMVDWRDHIKEEGGAPPGAPPSLADRRLLEPAGGA